MTDDWQDAPCGLLRTDAAGRVLRANTTLCRWLGFGEDEIAGKRTLSDLLTMGGRIYFQTHVAPLLRLQEGVSELRLDVRAHDGSVIPTLANLTRQEDGGMAVAFFVVNDRALYEKELLATRNRAEESLGTAEDRALFAEQMMGIVSHDLRNPLMAVSVGLEWFSEHPLSARQDKVRVHMTRAVERAVRLIRDLLDFTAARVGGGLALERKTTDVAELMDQGVTELRLTFPQQPIELTVDGARDFPLDGDRTLQLLGNLVGNAARYGAPGRPVRIAVSNADEFMLTVHNEGPAIPFAQQGTLFDAMVRGSTSHRVEGVGLGLFVVRAIARAHGGDVSLHSEEGAGTTFTVVFRR